MPHLLLYSLSMITCHLRYVIDPHKLPEFEAYARLWIPLVSPTRSSPSTTLCVVNYRP